MASPVRAMQYQYHIISQLEVVQRDRVRVSQKGVWYERWIGKYTSAPWRTRMRGNWKYDLVDIWNNVRDGVTASKVT